MPYKKPVIEKLYYSMRETSAMFGVNQSTLRFWEKEFDVIKPYKNAKGTRYFRQEDIKNLHLIYFMLKEQGMTLKGAKKRLNDNREKTIKNFELISKLNEIKEQLVNIRDQINIEPED